MQRFLCLLAVFCLLFSLLLGGCSLPARTQGTPSATLAPTAKATASPKPVYTPRPTPSAMPDPTAEPTPKREGTIEFPSGRCYHYDMDLTLDTALRTVGGHILFDFFNDSDDVWDRLCLRDYASLFIDAKRTGYDAGMDLHGAMTEISGITDGRSGTVLSYSREDDVSIVWISLPVPLNPGEEMSLAYDFCATIPTVPDRYGVENGIFSVANFYPILAEYENGDWSRAPYFIDGECFYSEIANYEVNLTVPSAFTVVATGTESARKKKSGTVTYSFRAPYVRDFVFAASSGFVLKDTTCDGVHINVAYNASNPPNADMNPYIDAILEAAEDSLSAFGEAFGKYPYDELDIVICCLSAGGMEYPNLILISENYCTAEPVQDPTGLDSSAQKAATLAALKICVAHEIGHQWFMGIVGSNSGMQPWQDESLTSYSELVYLEYVGELNPMSFRIQTNSRNSLDLSDPVIAAGLRKSGAFPINRPSYELPQYVYSIYSLGQTVFYQMEEIIGRKEFHAILHEYVRRNAFRNASPEDFFAALFESAGTGNEKLNALISAAFDGFAPQ